MPSPAFPTNPTLAKAQAQWIFTSEDLHRTPSVLDGLAMSTEHEHRAKGVNFITQVGIMLKLPQLTLATASVYLHRFFMRYSMVTVQNRVGMHHYAVAATAIFLATKVEESSRKMRELIIACCRVAQKQPNIVVDEQSKEYWKWRDTILYNEDLLLEALCFDLQLEQPYQFLFDFLCYYNVQENKLLRNAAWAFVNDSTLTVLCLLFPARTIAASALYAAAKHTKTAFPDDDYGRPWWEHLGIEIKNIRQACNKMAEVYENTPLPRQGDKGAYINTPEDDDEVAAKTRITSTTNIHSIYSPATSAGSEGQGVKRDREDGNDDDDDNQSKNGTSQNIKNGVRTEMDYAQHSPKRLRQSEPPSEILDRLSSAPAVATTSDDVQSRIDAIVSASAAAPPRPQSRENPWRRDSSTQQRRRSPNSNFARERDFDGEKLPHRERERDIRPGYDSRSQSGAGTRADRPYNKDGDRWPPAGGRADEKTAHGRSMNGHDVPRDVNDFNDNDEGNGSEEGEL